jgi:protein subunit release factor A
LSEKILDESELIIELLLPDNLDSLSVGERVSFLTAAPVRVTHKPTGLSTVGEGCGNQVMNKLRAVELLKEQLGLEKNS